MTQLTKGQTIAIDGPAGAGKSTVAREVARRLGYLYLDTGAMYRALTVKALREQVGFEDEAALTQLAARTGIDLRPETDDHGRARIFLDGEDVTRAIRTPEVNQFVSLVAKSPGVRKVLVHLQRQLAKDGRVVVEGRDIASNVLPGADCKIFLTASLEVRARRRLAELVAAGFGVTLEEVVEDLSVRDRMDSQREVAPLVCVESAQVVDTSDLTIDEVVDTVIRCCREKG
ncbi:MAG: (d)CMP kinase [Bacillota bacterium]